VTEVVLLILPDHPILANKSVNRTWYSASCRAWKEAVNNIKYDTKKERIEILKKNTLVVEYGGKLKLQKLLKYCLYQGLLDNTVLR